MLDFGSGSRGRSIVGALCPFARLVPGAGGDVIGDRLCPDPVWETAFFRCPRARCLRRPLPLEAPMVTPPRPPAPASRLSPHLDAINLHAAGIAVGATEHYVAV